MIKDTIKITNEQGLHMRPAGLLTKEMGKMDCDITIHFNNNDYNAKSIMNVMAACIKCGAEIEVTCEGNDEQKAMDKFKELALNGFGE